MSWGALAWAAKTRVERASEKLILIALCDRHNDETGFAYPSINWLCEFSSLNRKTVISALDRLEDCGLIADSGRRVGSTKQVKVYTINVGKESQNRNSSENGREEYRKRDTEPVSNLSSEAKASSESSKPSEFDDFWKLYPHKKAKGAARKAYLKARKAVDHGTLVRAVDTQVGWGVWANSEFSPHAATWLNNERWADEPDSNQGQAGKPTANGNGSKPTGMAGILAERRRQAGNPDDVSSGGGLLQPDDGLSGIWINPGQSDSGPSGGGIRDDTPDLGQVRGMGGWASRSNGSPW